MAKSGMPLGEIREHFSKHRSTEMLLGYLKWGSVSAHQAQIQTHALKWTTARTH